MPDNDRDENQLRKLASLLDLHFDEITRVGSEGNVAGIQSKQLLFSHRLDSRTYFVQDQRFGVGREWGSFEGSDDALRERALRIMERLDIPADEIAEPSVLREQTQAAEVNRQTGAISMEEVQEGKKLAHFTRQINALPVWSSNLIMGLTKDGQVGFLQLHWPEIPAEIVDQARKLASQDRLIFHVCTPAFLLSVTPYWLRGSRSLESRLQPGRRIAIYTQPKGWTPNVVNSFL